MKQQIDSEITPQEKKWLIALGLIIVIMITAIVTMIIVRHFQPAPSPVLEKENANLVFGNSRDYLPTIADLPNGFVLMEDEPIAFSSGGNVHTKTFTNSDFLFQGREVNVIYTLGIFDEITVAQEIFDTLYNGTPGMTGILSIEPDRDLGNNFSNLDAIEVLFAHELTELDTFAISYTVLFRYKNLMTMLIVSAPVDDFDSDYAKQVKAMLSQASLYYANMVTKKLPEQIQSNVPQPPFGAVALELARDSSVYFSDDFEDEQKTKQLWKVIDGDWQIINGTYFCRATATRCLSLAGDPGMNNYKLSVDIKGKEGVDKFVFVGVIEGKQLYQIKFRTNPYNDLILTQQLPGIGNTILKEVPIQNKNGRWYHFEILVFENSLQVFVDGRSVMVSSNLPNNLTGQIALGLRYSSAVGAGITSVYFDNVVVEPYE